MDLTSTPEDRAINAALHVSTKKGAGGDMVLVPRVLLEAARMEIRSVTAHWAVGLAPLEHLIKHDRRMDGGLCSTCQLLELIEYYASEEPA